jgi:hypothetical protein
MNVLWSVKGWILSWIQAYRVKNNIPTLYILEINSSKVKMLNFVNIFSVLHKN